MHFGFARLIRVTSPLLIAGCIFHHPPAAPADSCWTDDAPVSSLEEAAVVALLPAYNPTPNRLGDRLRGLVGIPLIADSLRAHTERILDPALCARLWQATDPGDGSAKIAAIRVGNTYWIRWRGGRVTEVLDHRLRHVIGFVDQ